MKTILSIIILLVFQSPEIIELKDFYDGKGVVFDKDYNFPFRNEKYNKPLSPNLTQIQKAENIFFRDYYSHRKEGLKKFNSHYKLDKKFSNSKIVKKKYNYYYRQYASYLSTENDTIIYIGLFNFSKKRQAKKYFQDWNKTLFLGSGEFYLNNQEFYEINLSKNKIEFN
ncbi:hypothetical protein FLJC2902T_32020 [Flavobacterium limnosediminis JC2902]|uniref:Uncharacterized protein n=1 Tax=Flavobacterium limnosediminis JC2902 TaxID=1341181 RepID=V6SE67_9FLAO|nr:hypothetical protein [Flavobacterium limnosediminis]ESU24562.1 hypothetical protein FLJC2902T_32020 [Flavobacterium limnosediminis JC2902]